MGAIGNISDIIGGIGNQIGNNPPGQASNTPALTNSPPAGGQGSIATDAKKTPPHYNVVSVMLALGLELLMLGIATGVANTSEEVGKIILVLMIGFLILFMMYHAMIVQTIPNLFGLLQQGKL